MSKGIKLSLRILSAENPDLSLGFLGQPPEPPPLGKGCLGFYLRLSKELEKGPFSIIVFLTTPNEKLFCIPFSSFLSWLVLCTDCWEVVGGGRGRVCDEIGVSDRTREEGLGLDFSYHLMEPFGV